MSTIENTCSLIGQEEQISAATKLLFEVLILLISLLANRLGLNCNDSSKSPSSDPSGQNGYIGTILHRIEDPELVIT